MLRNLSLRTVTFAESQRYAKIQQISNISDALTVHVFERAAQS